MDKASKRIFVGSRALLRIVDKCFRTLYTNLVFLLPRQRM
jgi:hypothetical protein